MKRVFELTEIGNYLVEKGVVNTEDMIFMAQLSDTYRNERFIERQSGSRWLVFGEGILSRRVSASNSKTAENISGGINFFYHKPLKQQWQLDITAGARFENDPFFNTFTDTSPDLAAGINVTTTLGYYPNARTNIEFSIDSGWSEYFSDEFIFDIDPFNLTAEVEAMYFLNPFTSFNGRVIYRTDDNGSSFFTPRNKILGFQLGVSHTVF